MTRSFQLIDVFGTKAFTGNPLAVIADADDLTTEEMQRITQWLNLSETAFLLAPTDTNADYRVRIFTLARELPFAGHPTLGSCHAWLEAGGWPRQDDDYRTRMWRRPGENTSRTWMVILCRAAADPRRIADRGGYLRGRRGAADRTHCDCRSAVGR